jgi:hypothetical protein
MNHTKHLKHHTKRTPRAQARGCSNPPRRAFALPLVILLSLVVGISTAMMLERQAAQSYFVQRQITAYQDDHLGKGMEEIINQWLAGASTRPIEERLQSDGRALEMRLAGGVTLTLYVRDGQGAALQDLSSLTGEALQDARGILRELRRDGALSAQRRNARGRNADPILRMHGPVQISINSADQDVLRAVLRSITGSDRNESYLGAIRRARAEGRIDPNKFSTINAESDLTPEERAKIERVLTSVPRLWILEAVITRTNPAPLERAESRYRGVAFIEPRGGISNRDRPDGVTRLGSILEWRRVPD